MSNFRKVRVVIPESNHDGRAWNASAFRRHKPSPSRHTLLACEALEGRVVLTFAGTTSLLGSLSYVGVVTSPVIIGSVPILPIDPLSPTPIIPLALARASSTWSQLRADLQTLRDDLQSLAQKSGVTIADLQSLTTDSQSIALAGFHFDVKSLNPVIALLATAVATPASTEQAQTDFTALFGGSSVSATTINTTFTDLVQTIQDSAVTTTDLSTVAADEAAIQADLSKLPIPWLPGPEPWLDQVGATPDAVSLAPLVVSPAPPMPLPAIIAEPPIIVQPPYIISPFGNASLLGGLSSVGVVTSPVIVAPFPRILSPVMATAMGPYSQLQADVQQLQTELQSLAAKSGLTIADLQNLVSDSQAIYQAGFYYDAQSLNKVIAELATAVAGGMSTGQAQTDFAALFNGSSVSTTTINTTFSDLTKAIQDSRILPDDLTTVAADQAAIQADLKNLYPGKGDGSGSGPGSTGTGGTTGSGSTGDNGGHKTRGGRRKLHNPQHIKLKPVKLVHARKLERLRKP